MEVNEAPARGSPGFLRCVWLPSCVETSVGRREVSSANGVVQGELDQKGFVRMVFFFNLRAVLFVSLTTAARSETVVDWFPVARPPAALAVTPSAPLGVLGAGCSRSPPAVDLCRGTRVWLGSDHSLHVGAGLLPSYLNCPKGGQLFPELNVREIQ